MAVVGFALAGMVPLVIMYSKGLAKLERSGPMILPGINTTWYLIPSSDAWTCKLGAAAQLTSDASKLATCSSPWASIAPSLVLRNDYNDGTDSDGDGNPDFVDTDTGWDYVTGVQNAFLQDYHVHPALPAGSSSGGGAVWSFAISTPGWYSIQATWPTTLGLALTTVQYQITLAGAPLAVSPITVNQANTAAGLQDGTAVWFKLTPGLVYLTPGLLQVQLSDVQPVSTETGNSVVADAVRLVENDVQVLSLERALKTENVTAHVTVTTRICQ